MSALPAGKQEPGRHKVLKNIEELGSLRMDSKLSFLHHNALPFLQTTPTASRLKYIFC
jgi:hypothetical protein